ncbi:MAG: type II toxin-antitoxin system VapC family toxin [Candidatus Hydrogenedentes bacterium]|nr:type II toxin-antitoxin system VapC family toxin [Candidatus Hydrogenedentota bacterium]
MLFDTDVIIWALRGNRRAAAAIDRGGNCCLSVVSYMELLQGARDKHDLRRIREYVAGLHFQILPLTEDIGHRACVYVEEHTLKSGLGIADALIAATAVDRNVTLCTGNAKHYRIIAELDVIPFRPA